MFEFEEMSSGFHDVFLNKCADSSGPILDLYISDSMQDMLDIDIRTEVATIVGGTNEFASLVNDLPSLDIESSSQDGDISWLGGPKWSAINDLYADVGACVNPNSVMPIISSSVLNSPKSHISLNVNNYRTGTSPPISPKEKKSHLTFSPHQIKISSNQDKRPSQLPCMHKAPVEAIKKDLVTELKDEPHNAKQSISSNTIPHTNQISNANAIKVAPGIAGLTFANNVAFTKFKQTSGVKVPTTSSQPANILMNNVVIKKERESSPLRHNNVTAVNVNNHVFNHNSNSNRIPSRNVLIQNKNTTLNGIHSTQGNNTQLTNNNTSGTIKCKSKLIEYEYPKPAYSYSCLIAMALKNSRSGSLPVSEIYSFMCEHFPYFKTAPNGWKNSVRHNLSLNKCFEKIEKPATNGGQRKGCLWAMNPTKISKMDEEVQKWSRKDPLAIRKAMVYPENLEALERGEMKHGSTGESDGENDNQSDIEENSDSEPDNDMDENLVETPESIDEEEDEQEKDIDVEVSDLYDTIDLEDNKEAVRLEIQRNEMLQLGENFPSPKRARLDVNYSIGPAGAFEQQIHNQQQLQQAQHYQQQQHHQQQNQQNVPQQHHSRRKMQLVNRII